MAAAALTKPEYRDQYLKAVDEFLWKSNELEIETAWMKNRLGSIMLKELPVNQTIRILSVGCGNGIKNCAPLEALRDRRVHYTALDSSREVMQQFQDHVVCDSRFSDVVFWVLTTTCEEFVEQDNRDKYDLIHFVHVIYCLSSVGLLLLKYLRLLSPGGLLVILCNARDAPLERVRTRILRTEPTSPDIGAILPQLGYEYWKDTSIASHLDISSLYSQENPDAAGALPEEAELLLNFLAYKGNFRQNYPPSTVTDFLQSLKASVVQQGDKLLLEWSVDAFFIRV